MPEKLTQGPLVNYDLAKTGAGLGRGPIRKNARAGAPWASGAWPAPQSTLDLDFANDRGFVRGVGQGKSMDAVTFTRASNGTFVGSDGFLKTYSANGALGVNLLAYPQFETGWTTTASGITINTEVAPNGTLTAAKVFENTQNNVHTIRVSATISANTTYTLSIYAKAAERSWLAFDPVYPSVANNITYFDLKNGTVGTNAAGNTASITDVGNGWYRCVVSRTTAVAQTSLFYQVAPANADNGVGYQGDGTSGIYIWGAQLEVGSTATEYYPTNINTPRFDWASTAQVASKNLLTYTEQFDNAVWNFANSGITRIANQAIAPNGLSTADELKEDTSNGEHRIFGYNTDWNMTIGSAHTFSFYVKANGRTKLQVAAANLGLAGINFDLVAKTAGTGGTITELTDGWFRCQITGTASANPFSTPIRLQNDSSQTVYTGDGTSGVYIWGAQLELGSSATDYTGKIVAASYTPLTANPTCNGLLIEESRANRLLWCRDATNAAWTKTNVTAAKDQTGIDGVANAASSLTASADGGTCIQTITLASGSRTGSVYLKRITGTGSVQVSLDGTTWSTVDLSSTEWRRIVLSGTVTNPTVGIRLATNGDAVAMDYGQIEDGAFATSPILTTTASVTRNADTASVFKNSTWFSESEATIYVEAPDAISLQASGFYNVVALSTSTSGSPFVIRTRTVYSAYQYGQFNSSPAPSAEVSQTFVPNIIRKHAISYSRGRFSAVGFGAIIVNNVATSSAIDSPWRELSIGCSFSTPQYTSYRNGCISRIVYVSSYLPAHKLLSMVTN